uniref:Uncharacterized protein n=1 Tax=Marseillevirus LCMAC202 TaxID=2506606 RepID=A0A481YX57_9VIRU|nr:MAG: hypothetical protein LCMAC202_01790 [Marseillevirus LCMAC202]
MSNVDPYNNAPPPRPGSGGCGGGTGGAPTMNQQYTGPPTPELQQQQIPQYGRTTSMSQRPMQTPGRPDLQTENHMLMADLQVAIQYIRQLGGKWPPPGQ